ncbi:MAG: transcription antitermination factor NusB [Pseudomonadota bacterium]
MADTGIPARRSAVYVLDQVLGEGRLMSELLAAGVFDKLPVEDRARAARLASDTLRGLERADRILQKHLSKYPPLTVRNVLRLGAVELCNGAAAHGVVNDMVEIVSRHKKLGHLKGLTNAVLRKVAQEGAKTWPNLRAPRLPKWLRRPLVEAWGPEAMSAMEGAHFAGAPLDLTAKTDAQAVAAMTGGTLLPTGSIRVLDAGQVSAMPGYADGSWWVQDAAAALPVRVLAPCEGETVLDLCAAPGGKTMQLAAAGAVVTAVDDSETRMARVQENLKRTGLAATLKVEDARRTEGQFDAVLLDAPCSATGTIRRHPDLPFAKDGSDFGDLIALQAEMLEHAWARVKPGGRMVFCTCSLLPDEGEVQIEEALSRHTDMSLDTAARNLPGVEAEWLSDEGGLRLRPDFWAAQGGMDGFYIACLRKAG